jgi:hypothetical protein
MIDSLNTACRSVQTWEEGVHDRLTNTLDTLLTALYVEIDEHVSTGSPRAGRRPWLADAELV